MQEIKEQLLAFQSRIEKKGEQPQVVMCCRLRRCHQEEIHFCL